MDQIVTILLITGAFLAAGTVKGAIGMGLPTTALGIMTLALDPRLAISLVLIPMIVTNAWQVFRSGDVGRAFRRYLPLSAGLVSGVAITVVATRDTPDDVLLWVLGGSILVFVLVSATAWAPKIPDHLDRPAQITTGIVAGVMGGLTSVWAPPMAVYLASRHVSKAEFVRASGLLIFLGSLPLAAGYIWQGALNSKTMLVSLAMLVPAFAGFALGEKLRHGLSETGFRKLMLFLFFLMGLNLIRRAAFS